MKKVLTAIFTGLAFIVAGCGSSSGDSNGSNGSSADYAIVVNLEITTTNGDNERVLRTDPSFSIQSTTTWQSQVGAWGSTYYIIPKAEYDANPEQSMNFANRLITFPCGTWSGYNCNMVNNFTCDITDYSFGLGIQCNTIYDASSGYIWIPVGEKYLVQKACVSQGVIDTCTHKAIPFTIQ